MKESLAHLLNDPRSLDLDVAATSETKVSRKHALASIFVVYLVFSSFGQSETGGGVTVQLWKSINLRLRAIFLDPDGRVVDLDINGSEGSAFRLVVVYHTSDDGRPDFFRCLETILGTSRALVLVGGLK